MKNRNKEILLELGLAREATIAPYYPRVRDRDDVGVLRDTESGVIFLDRSDHLDLSHYESMEGGSYWGGATREEAKQKYAADDARRAGAYAGFFEGKDVVDVGCGTGGLLDLLRGKARSLAGVEPQRYVREELAKEGYATYRLPEDLPPASFDVATLFCTVEHLQEPLKALAAVKKALRPGGLVIIEVPHGRDALLSLESFKKFTLWSEHCILHTRESLQKFLEAAGFGGVEVKGTQRYPLANHLGWLVTGEPGGHLKFPQLGDTEADAAYREFLMVHDKTDTLFATARA